MGHPVFARLYERMAPSLEQAGGAAHRDELLADLHGRVIEVGAGSGLCFAHYPNTVSEVVAVEPEPSLRRAAQSAAQSVETAIAVVDGRAEQLPADDAAFDAAVVSLVLCSVPDPATALNEIHRVLRPGGELRFYEHLRSEDPGQGPSPGPGRLDLAPRLGRLSSQPRHPNRHRRCRVLARLVSPLRVPALRPVRSSIAPCHRSGVDDIVSARHV